MKFLLKREDKKQYKHLLLTMSLHDYRFKILCVCDQNSLDI